MVGSAGLEPANNVGLQPTALPTELRSRMVETARVELASEISTCAEHSYAIGNYFIFAKRAMMMLPVKPRVYQIVHLHHLVFIYSETKKTVQMAASFHRRYVPDPEYRFGIRPGWIRRQSSQPQERQTQDG